MMAEVLGVRDEGVGGRKNTSSTPAENCLLVKTYFLSDTFVHRPPTTTPTVSLFTFACVYFDTYMLLTFISRDSFEPFSVLFVCVIVFVAYVVACARRQFLTMFPHQSMPRLEHLLLNLRHHPQHHRHRRRRHRHRRRQRQRLRLNRATTCRATWRQL